MISTDYALTTRAAYDDAVAKAAAAAAAYYNTDVVVMDDGEYDALVHAIAAADKDHPEWDDGQRAVTDAVAAGQGVGDVAHTTPMLSLDNVFSPEELQSWAIALDRKVPAPVTRFTIEPKMDGLALVARYRGGVLTQLVTRGNGTAGEDVTFAAANIVGLPAQLTKPVDLEVRGEVMLTDAQFHSANDLRLANDDKPFANARNGAAGALRGAKDRPYVIPMTFFGYGVASLGDQLDGSDVDDMDHSAAMSAIADLGISTTGTSAAGMGVVTSVDEAFAWIADLLTRRSTLGFAIDGAVVKADRVVDRVAAGFSSRAPRWGIAYKFPPDMRFSTLEEVIWQVGKTGVITPRARIAPVLVGGTVISFATLHNPADMVRKGFMLHDTVSVVRAGEVIPRLEAPIVDKRTGAEEPILAPEVCPQCESAIDRSQVRWRCTRGRACGLEAGLRYAASRDCWDIEGMGGKLVEQLVSSGLVSDVAGLFTLTRADLLKLDRMGELSADGVLEQVELAKSSPLARTIAALGIRGTGRSMSRRLAAAFGSMDALRAATAAELQAVDGIGPEKAPVIVEELAELASVIDRLAAAGVAMQDTSSTQAVVADGPTEAPLAGMSVVVTGKMTGPLAALGREEMREFIERCGGKSSSTVSAKTSLLVAGEKAGSKFAKAQALGVLIEDPEEFAKRVSAYLS